MTADLHHCFNCRILVGLVYFGEPNPTSFAIARNNFKTHGINRFYQTFQSINLF